MENYLLKIDDRELFDLFSDYRAWRLAGVLDEGKFRDLVNKFISEEGGNFILTALQLGQEVCFLMAQDYYMDHKL